MLRNWAGLALAAALVGGIACGPAEDADDVVTLVGALTSQDVLGFETVDSWRAASGTAASTTTRTQGAAAFALTAPVGFTNIVSAAIDSTAANLAVSATPARRWRWTSCIPTQQPNPFFLGSLQLLVNAPSRNVFNQFLGQVELTGPPLGTFQTLRFRSRIAARRPARRDVHRSAVHAWRSTRRPARPGRTSLTTCGWSPRTTPSSG